MNEFFSNFHFLRPYLLMLLIIPVYLYWKYYKQLQSSSSWQKICDKKLLDFLLIKDSATQRKTIAYLAMLSLVSGIIGAAGPSWNKKEIQEMMSDNPLMILLNVSSDMQKTDLPPNRLDRAKYKIKDLLQQLQSVQVGLIVYSSEPFLISPITKDTKLIENLLPEINMDIMPVNGNRLDKAINYAVEKLANSEYKTGNILIFAPDSGNEFQQALKSASVARQQGYIINIDITSSQKSEQLDILAQRGGGEAILLSGNDKDIKVLTKDINIPRGELKDSESKRTIWFDNGYYFTFICIICALYFFRRGILLTLFIILFSNQAEAGFFKNSNQEALADFNKGDYNSAATKFTSPEWQGASLYKSGNYEQAYQAFAKGNDINSIYNQGNALAKGGKIEEAIKKYEEVLKNNPQHENAKFNLEYLKRQQQEQQQNNSGSNNSENNQNQQEENKSEGGQQNDYQQKENNGDNQNSAQNNREEQEAENKKNDGEHQAGDEKEQNTGNNRQKAPPSGDLEKKDENKEQQNSGTTLQNDSQEPKYDEEAQARAQQYREIPEDVGGLLKAFIRKEYQMRKAR